ncbi:phage holin family protein [Pseudonocardia nigra]|uniref:phage holin family protein n=1 Tax=Pseudonocardia nigra TaxID=1921578 RepID=UPI001C5DDAE3|nr:phage holin family protein [Pseudonocardia nigra]
MSVAGGAGRLLRGGRVVARLLLVWLLSVGALQLLDELLIGFSMADWWQPTVCALLFGVLSAVVWPLILRIALPVALFTLGIGSFLLLGAGVLAISFAVPGVVVTDFGTAVVVAVAVAAIGALVSSLLALDEDELFFRRAARRRARSGPGGDGELPPGVLFLQVDGLGYDTVRRAIRDGDMPTFARWLATGSHTLTDWYADWSSQTGASVCGILHGDNHDILGFRWYEKDRDHIVACANPEDAAEIERRHSDGRGLLAVDGAARGNLFTGDAEHVSLTMSALPVLTGSRRRRGSGDGVGAGYYAYFANPANALRTLAGALVDVAREVSASVRQRRAGVRPRVNRGGFYPFARAGTTVIARDVVVSAIIEDMLAGRASVYADFLGYDEVAHHSGVERFDALAVLRSIDQQIGRLHRARQLAPRRYHIVALSDHGQTQGWAFADRFGESIEALVGRLCGAPQPDPRRGADTDARRPAEGWQVGAALAEASAGGGPIARRLRARVERAAADHPRTATGTPDAASRAAPGVVVVSSGHLALASFTDHPGRVELETVEREHPELLPSLVDHPGVGFVLVRSAEFGPVVLGRDGLHRLATGVVIGEDPLTPYGPHAAELIRRVDGFPHCADLMINSRYDPATDEAPPFEPHVGSHGGMGGSQSRGFVLYPSELPAPGEIVGAEALHRVLRGWLTHLGQPEPPARVPDEDADRDRDRVADPAARA